MLRGGDDSEFLKAYAWTLTMIAKILARVIREGSTIVMKAIEVGCLADLSASATNQTPPKLYESV